MNGGVVVYEGDFRRVHTLRIQSNIWTIMINVYKLEKLPRSQRLRKAASIFAAAERRCVPGENGEPETRIDSRELLYLCDIAGFLSRDSDFTPEVARAFSDSADLFARSASVREGIPQLAEPRRALNTMRHLLLAETGRSQADWDFLDSGGRLDCARRTVFPGMRVYLDEIRSPFNVGAMFRTAESFGAEKIFVSKFCADPNHVRSRRTSMGCVDALPWERTDPFCEDAADEAPGPIFALETGGTPLSHFAFPKRGLLIAGSEELGVSPRSLAAADSSLGRVSIPSHGAKGSLNVSVAFGIVMQAWAEWLVGEEHGTPYKPV